MDPTATIRRKNVRLLWMLHASLVLVIIYCSVANSWRISQKCPHGHYYNDGCTACWCDIRTGHTKCEKSLDCSRKITNEKCLNGRNFKDKCGNDCTCYGSTGAVLCNEVRKCPQENPSYQPSMASSTSGPMDSNIIRKRSGFTTSYVTSYEQPPITFQMQDSSRAPIIMSTPSSIVEDSNGLYQNIAIASTPHPQVRIPSVGHSEELIIEPAIIVRKKGSNKASIVRNPSSATTVTLPSSRQRSQDHLISNRIDSKSQDGSSYTSKASSFSPLHLYEKQLQTIMNIRRAYSQLLRAKVNFNFQIAAGKSPITPIPPEAQVPDSQTSSDHPRRFDVNYNSTFLTDIPRTPFPVQHPSPSTTSQPNIWRADVKNVLKQFSPVPPLKQLVSYVSSSTENYLKDFLNRNRLKSPIHLSIASTPFPPPLSPSPVPPTMTPQMAPSPTLASYPYQPYTTANPYQDQHHSPTTVSIDHVYSSQGYFTPTQNPSPFSHGQNSYSHKTTDVSQNGNELMKKEHFPNMHNFMRDFARMDSIPSSTVRQNLDTLSAYPTHTTPGPPYAEIQEVRPLAFAPPPQQRPTQEIRRAYNQQQEAGRYPPPTYQPFPQNFNTPTVRVNLDKPIYVNAPNPPQLQNRRFFPQFFPPHSYQNRKTFPPPPNRFPPPSHFPHNQHPPQMYHYPPPHMQFPHQNLVHHNPPPFPKYFIPKPKQYRLTLKGSVRDAAVKMDDVVPRFVDRIAHEFFKKPEIYVPKIRPGKPLTLERVVLNHKEIVPPEMSFSSKAGEPPMKLRFTPQAQWEMKEELAKQGIMLNGPLTAVRDYSTKDPNVMELDVPFRAMPTWERHSSLGLVGALGDDLKTFNQGTVPPQVYQQETSPSYQPILLPSPTPTVPTSMDEQHRRELQHQILLAQEQNSRPQYTNNDNVFKFDQADFNDFKLDNQDTNVLPQELQVPGVKQVVVDKYVVRDPLDPAGPVRVFTKTTVNPPLETSTLDIPSVLNEHRRNGLAALPAHGPTFPPAVLVRHHGAPSPGTTPPPEPLPSSVVATTFKKDNVLVTVISSTPRPFVTTTPSVGDTEMDQQDFSVNRQGIADQIHDFLEEQMDFGARPESNLYEMMMHHRNEEEFSSAEKEIVNEYISDDLNNANERAHHSSSEVQSSNGQPNMDTDSVANIFSIDYKNKYNQSPPAVIVIKVPHDPGESQRQKSVDQKKSKEVPEEEKVNSRQEVRSHNDSSKRKDSRKNVRISSSSIETRDNKDSDAGESEEETSAERRRRERKNRKKKRRRRKKKNRGRQNDNDKDVPNLRLESREDLNRRIEGTGSRRESKSDSLGMTKVELISSREKSVQVDDIQEKNEDAASEQFQAEIDWKSKLMANICEVNPNSPLCLTYRSICLLMTSED